MTSDAPLDVSRILPRVASRMTLLAEDTSRLEDGVAKHLIGVTSAQPEMIRELQHLDHLRQSLDDLAQLTSCLACLPGTGTTSRPLRAGWEPRLKMSATRAILLEETGLHAHDPSESGSAHLF